MSWANPRDCRLRSPRRPYNYPDLFVSVLEFCIAALVAAVLNYFFQGPATKTIRTVKNSAPAAVEPARMFPQPTTTAALTQTPSPYIPPAPVIKAEPVTVQAPRFCDSATRACSGTGSTCSPRAAGHGTNCRQAAAHRARRKDCGDETFAYAENRAA